ANAYTRPERKKGRQLSPLFMRKRLSVIGVFAIAVVGHVTHTLEFGNTIEQGFLDTFLEGVISLTTALETTTELQHGDALVDYVDQADLTAVAGQTGIDLGLQVVIDAFVQRTILVDHRHLGVRRLDGQLAAHAVGSVVDYGIFEERLADRVDPGREAGQPNGGVFRLLLTRLAVGDAGFRIGRTRLGDENADADTRGVLL